MEAIIELFRGIIRKERWAPKKERDRCGRTLMSGCKENEPCFDHRYFKCPQCKRWVSWSFGCADDMPELCDDCWTSKH